MDAQVLAALVFALVQWRGPRSASLCATWQSVSICRQAGVPSVTILIAHISASEMQDTLAGGVPQAAASQCPLLFSIATAAVPYR